MHDFLDGIEQILLFTLKLFFIVGAIGWIYISIEAINSNGGLIPYFNSLENEGKVFVIIGDSIAIWVIARYIFGFTFKFEIAIDGFWEFVLKNIVAPVIVSLIVWGITGSPGFTLFSIPVFSFLSLKLDIG